MPPNVIILTTWKPFTFILIKFHKNERKNRTLISLQYCQQSLYVTKCLRLLSHNMACCFFIAISLANVWVPHVAQLVIQASSSPQTSGVHKFKPTNGYSRYIMCIWSDFMPIVMCLKLDERYKGNGSQVVVNNLSMIV